MYLLNNGISCDWTYQISISIQPSGLQVSLIAGYICIESTHKIIFNLPAFGPREAVDCGEFREDFHSSNIYNIYNTQFIPI